MLTRYTPGNDSRPARARRRRAFVGALTAAVLLTMAPPGGADVRTVTDPDDSEGALDLMEVEHDHEVDEVTGQQLVVHRLSTYEDWDDDLLAEDPIANNLTIYFDVAGPHRRQRTLVIATEEDGSLYAEMRSSGGSVRGYARAWRIDARTVAVAFPKRLLRRGLEAYDWWAVAATAGDCGEEPVPGCPHDIDRVPDEGAIKHGI